MSYSIRNNLDRVRQKMKPETILIAVTKGRTNKEIEDLSAFDIRLFGENLVQEAQKKWPALLRNMPQESELHMIGHLQTNKVREAVALFDMIQSVDSIRLLSKIHNEAEKQQKSMRVFIQVNISREPQKFGVFPKDVLEFFRNANPLLVSPWIKIEGLMAIVEHTKDIEALRLYFRKMKEIFDDVASVLQEGHIENVEMKYLSMGMSEDFEIAIEEGSNMVRIGRAIFEG